MGSHFVIVCKLEAGLLVAIISASVAVIGLILNYMVVPFFKKRAIKPRLKMELQPAGSYSNQKNQVKVRHRPDKTEYYIHTWVYTSRYNLVVYNQSPFTAYFPKLTIENAPFKITEFSVLNKMKPIIGDSSIMVPISMSYEYDLEQNSPGKSFTAIPAELDGFSVLLSYKNQYDKVFYTRFSIKSEIQENIFSNKKKF
jgi:hypothetical protein